MEKIIQVIASDKFKNWFLRSVIIFTIMLVPIISVLTSSILKTPPLFWFFCITLLIILITINLGDYYGFKFLGQRLGQRLSQRLKKPGQKNNKFLRWIFMNKLISWDKKFNQRYFPYTSVNHYLIKYKTFASFPLLAPVIVIPWPLFWITFLTFAISFASWFFIVWSPLTLGIWFIGFSVWIVLITNLYCTNLNDSLKPKNVIYQLLNQQIINNKISNNQIFLKIKRQREFYNKNESNNSKNIAEKIIWWFLTLTIMMSLNFLLGAIVLGSINMFENPWSLRSAGLFSSGGILFNGYSFVNGIVQLLIGLMGLTAVTLLWLGNSLLPQHFDYWKRNYLITSLVSLNILALLILWKNSLIKL